MKVHRSTGDWDFKTTSWELDSTVYVSAPSSLHFTAALNNALVKTATVPIAYVKEGRLVTYLRGSAYCRFDLAFRLQDPDNCYFVQLRTGLDYQYIFRKRLGTPIILQMKQIDWLPLNTWKKVRVTWWNDYVGLVIRVEYWDGENWVKLLDDGYDSENWWKDVGGRVGMGDIALSEYSQYTFYDDTEIYGLY